MAESVGNKSGKYVVKQTNKNLMAYMLFKEQANAIWNANQKDPICDSERQLQKSMPGSYDKFAA